MRSVQDTAIIQYIEKEIEESVLIGGNNPYEQILTKANPREYEWMKEYPFPVTEEEKKTAEFYFTYVPEKIQRMGQRIADAFLHGFISQNRRRGARKRVRVHYQVGQEALAGQIVKSLKEYGLAPVVIRPGMRSFLAEEFPVLDGVAEELMTKWYRQAFEKYECELQDICGMVGIVEFGQSCYMQRPADRQRLERCRRLVEDDFVKPAEISFCKAAFPCISIGSQFEAIFEDVMNMNLEESEPFEKIQQILIDSMDMCQYFVIKGKGDNKTSLTIQMQTLLCKDSQTNFMNCGGDLNIPYGEVFTTPKLKGSEGVLHIHDIYLQNRSYHDLKIEFKDGEIIDCFYESEEGKDSVEIEKGLPIGEFAIGTNTRAFRICKKYQLGAKLPILIYEKMGPHIAIGDPCYRGAEEETVYNLLDGKEIMAKTNERTSDLTAGMKRYVHKHIDITLPYDEVGELFGYTDTGRKIEFLRDGVFVLEGTERLNVGMAERNEV